MKAKDKSSSGSKKDKTKKKEKKSKKDKKEEVVVPVEQPSVVVTPASSDAKPDKTERPTGRVRLLLLSIKVVMRSRRLTICAAAANEPCANCWQQEEGDAAAHVGRQEQAFWHDW